MAKYRSYRAQSRENWGTYDEHVDDGQLRTGCLLRIADATEAMARHHSALIEEVKSQRRLHAMDQAEIRRLVRANAVLRGHLRKAKEARRG